MSFSVLDLVAGTHLYKLWQSRNKQTYEIKNPPNCFKWENGTVWQRENNLYVLRNAAKILFGSKIQRSM